MTIREWREHHQMSQGDVARACRLAQPTISELEHRKRPLFKGYKAQLAQAFRCSPDDITV